MKKALLVALLAFSMNAFAQTPDWLWAKSINGTTSAADVGKTAITLDKSGNIYTTGRFSGTVDFDPGVGTYNLTSVSADGSGFILKSDAAGNFIWAKRMGGTPPDEGATSITIDAQGNVYTIGYFTGTVDFDPGTGVFNLSSSAQGDAFISKLDKDGNFVWAKSMSGDFGSRVYSIALDSSGNVYTTGIFIGTVDFNPGTETFNFTASGDGDMFISKLDSLGNFVWAKDFASLNVTLSNAISIDVSGNVYTTGIFLGTVDFDPGTGVYNLTSNQSAFISKLDASGNFVWVKQIGGFSGGLTGAALALDVSGNIYTTGGFTKTVDFDPGSEIFNLTPVAGSQNIFVSKYTSSGNFVWAKAMGGIGGDIGKSIALDNDGNIYTTGDFQGTADFDPGEGVFNLITSIAYGVAYISKLDNMGNFIWANSIAGVTGGTQYSSVSCSYIAIDAAANNAYVTGNFSTPAVSFGTIKLTKTAGYSGGFIAKLGDKTTGIERVVKSDDGISVYPNPTTGKFTISCNSTINSVEIYNLPGLRIYSEIKPTKQTSCEIDLSGQPRGIYQVRIKNGTKSSTGKIVIQ
jgi:hypothetical protein